MVLNGDVSLQQDAQQLEAQHVDYRPSTGDLSASGSVHYTDQGTTLHSESIDVNINSKALQTGPAEFSFRLDQNTLLANQSQQGRGEAAQIIRTEAGVVAFEDVDYTHCPLVKRAGNCRPAQWNSIPMQQRAPPNTFQSHLKVYPSFMYPGLGFPSAMHAKRPSATGYCPK